MKIAILIFCIVGSIFAIATLAYTVVSYAMEKARSKKEEPKK